MFFTAFVIFLQSEYKFFTHFNEFLQQANINGALINLNTNQIKINFPYKKLL